jgi:hypothetical protein
MDVSLHDSAVKEASMPSRTYTCGTEYMYEFLLYTNL